MTDSRTRWAAIGAAVAVTLGAGGIGITHATTDSGDGPVSAFFPIEPCRLISSAAIGADSSIRLNGWGASGDCTLPDDISALAANVTAVNASRQTNLRFYAQGDPVPGTANLNPTPGAPPTPNAVDIPLNDANGQFRVYNRFGSVAVFIDVMGYYDDHTHDDRYHTREQIDALRGPFVMSIAPSEFQPRRSATYGTQDPVGAIYLIDGMFTMEFFDTGLRLPAGSTVHAIDVYLDPNGTQTTALFERKDPLGSDGEVFASALSTAGTGAEGVELDVEHVIEQGWIYRLVVLLHENQTRLNGVEVTYSLPGP